MAGAPPVWATCLALASVPLVSVSLPVLAWARAVSALSPASASEETGRCGRDGVDGGMNRGGPVNRAGRR